MIAMFMMIAMITMITLLAMITLNGLNISITLHICFVNVESQGNEEITVR